MSKVNVHLFGRFEVYSDERPVAPFHCQKALELFCFLLLFRDKPHFREKLAEIFWGSRCTAESKKYFRKTLWQLQHTIDGMFTPEEGSILTVNGDWLEFNPNRNLWLDTNEFEKVLAVLNNRRGQDFSQQDFAAARHAASLYRGKLLESWYQEWCLYERERLEDSYFTLIEKLIDYCETNGRYQDGICYGRKLLEIDSSHEGTYQKLMRLHYLDGNRTCAIRLFEACCKMLKKEFNIEPNETTLGIYRQIVCNKSDHSEATSHPSQPGAVYNPRNFNAALEEIRSLVTQQEMVQKQLLQKIQVLEDTFLKNQV